MPRRRLAVRPRGRAAPASAIDLTSPPTQNVPRRPSKHRAHLVILRRRRTASTSLRVMSGFSALRRSGRFMMMVSSKNRASGGPFRLRSCVVL